MKNKTFSQLAIDFNNSLLGIQKKINITLPKNYGLMNPFAGGVALAISSDFYQTFYNDNHQRKIIFGINPGRHGAGLTGVPFTDSKQLAKLHIDARGIQSFEPSAVFIYEMIASFGGVKKFYQNFYLNSPLPLGLRKKNEKGNFVNANYYDNVPLQKSVEPMMQYAMLEYQKMPIDTSIGFCLGLSKNHQYLQKWNEQNKVFGKIIPLAHPRYIMQYKSREIEDYKKDYCKKLSAK